MKNIQAILDLESFLVTLIFTGNGMDRARKMKTKIKVLQNEDNIQYDTTPLDFSRDMSYSDMKGKAKNSASPSSAFVNAV